MLSGGSFVAHGTAFFSLLRILRQMDMNIDPLNPGNGNEIVLTIRAFFSFI